MCAFSLTSIIVYIFYPDLFLITTGHEDNTFPKLFLLRPTLFVYFCPGIDYRLFVSSRLGFRCERLPELLPSAPAPSISLSNDLLDVDRMLRVALTPRHGSV